MRYFFVILILCIVAFSATFNSPAWSQRRPAGYCDQAVSTAETLECVNRTNQDKQNKLSATFKALIEKQTEDNRTKLSESQKDWILYRDAQCAWEAGLTDTPALKRVYELSCLTAMTDQRVSLLEAVQNREAQPEPREFSPQPRWMNALAHDYPDIFWRYGQFKSADLDCDGDDEQIMTGISVADAGQSQPGKDNKQDPAGSPSLHEVELVVAISENPPTGRPKSTVLRLPVNGQQEGPHLCRPAIAMEVMDRLAPAPDKTAAAQTAGEQTTAPASCKALKINDNSCMPVMVIWTGKEYALETQQNGGGSL